MCDKIFITPDSTKWDPYSEHFAKNENAMLDCNGELIDLAERPDTLSPEIDPYHNFPSISTVNSSTDEVISAGMDNIARDQNSSSVPEDQSIPHHEAHDLADKLLNKALMGKISAALGVMIVDGECSDGKLLFTTILDDMECEFLSEISALEAGTPTGTKPVFLKRIWSISDKESNAVLEDNTQLNRQSND